MLDKERRPFPSPIPSPNSVLGLVSTSPLIFFFFFFNQKRVSIFLYDPELFQTYVPLIARQVAKILRNPSRYFSLNIK